MKSLILYEGRGGGGWLAGVVGGFLEYHALVGERHGEVLCAQRKLPVLSGHLLLIFPAASHLAVLDKVERRKS
jgi:hypothetical protein